MKRPAIMTDSNCGMSQAEAKELGLTILPMPFTIDGKEYLEGVDITQEEFYKKLSSGSSVSTSQPSPAALCAEWDRLLENNDEVLYIPMSSGLSGSCATAKMLAEDYGGRVRVVDNQRISVTMRQSVLDAMGLVRSGKDAGTIGDILEEHKFESSIYIMVDTLGYLKKGGRITAAAAALGTLLRLKPVLQIQGEKLDAFAKARTLRHAKNIMITAIRKDIAERFGRPLSDSETAIACAYTPGANEDEWLAEVQEVFPENDIYMQPLPLSISCHIGPGALAVTVSKIII